MDSEQTELEKLTARESGPLPAHEPGLPQAKPETRLTDDYFDVDANLRAAARYFQEHCPDEAWKLDNSYEPWPPPSWVPLP